MLFKYPVILFFINGSVPNDAEAVEAEKYGPNVRFRNGTVVAADLPPGAFEQCDGVAGNVPPPYRNHPSADKALGNFNEKRDQRAFNFRREQEAKSEAQIPGVAVIGADEPRNPKKDDPAIPPKPPSRPTPIDGFQEEGHRTAVLGTADGLPTMQQPSAANAKPPAVELPTGPQVALPQPSDPSVPAPMPGASPLDPVGSQTDVAQAASASNSMGWPSNLKPK